MKKIKRSAAVWGLAAMAGIFCGCGSPNEGAVVVNVDAAQKGIEISPTLYGLFYEEINHAGEGGLYAELISNRSFDEDVQMFRRGPRRGAGQRLQAVNEILPVAPKWSLDVTAGSAAKMSIEKSAAKQLNRVQTNALKLEIANVKETGGVVLKNEGFWGIQAVNGREYSLSFWACADRDYKGVEAGLVGDSGKVLAQAVLNEAVGSRWKKYSLKFTATGDDAQAKFFLSFPQKGTIYLDMVSLFPPTYKGRENGLRPELAQMLEDIHPKFMRFPGGCFVEGMSKESAFDWRITIGPVEERPGHMNLNWGYRCTDGFGYHEMLQFSEDIGAAPLFVVNVGIWHGGFEPYDQIDEYIQSALDAIEYANGDATTKYGAMRVANGHAEPFNLKYLEVGNENYQPDAASQSDHYAERYAQFYQAIKAKYPDMQIIGNVESWGTDNPSWRNDNPVDILDEHYYRTPAWFAKNYRKYDSYDRKGPKIYTGEYAVTSDCGQGNLNAALGEAIFMMGMENNSDVVTMCSYAPIFVNWHDRHWMPDMIRFNSAESYGSPSYWVQHMLSNHVGTRMVASDITVPAVDKAPNFGVGVGSWLTAVRYKDAVVTVGDKSIPLPFDDKWQTGNGEWNVVEDVCTQASLREKCTSLNLSQPVTEAKYSYAVKACKTGGQEGFLVLFNVRDENNYYWLNIGGWGNSANAVECISGNGKTTVTTSRGSIENDVWYDIRVDVDGNNVKCFLNNEMISEFTVTEPEQVYANAQIDEVKNELVVKMVNFGANEYPALIKMDGVNVADKTARIVTLSSGEGTDENTFEDPQKIVPQTTTVTLSGSKAKFTLAPYSVNIVRVKMK